MKEIWLDNKDETVDNLCRLVGYNGKKIRYIPNRIPTELNSYWDGGSRDYYYFVNLSENKIVEVSQNHPVYNPQNPSRLESLPNGVILVQRIYFCGKDLGLKIYANPADLSGKLLPESQDVTENEKIVLKFTYEYKNTYAGRKNIRFTEANESTGITQESWLEAQELLKSKKLLNKAGSITLKGKNALNQ